MDRHTDGWKKWHIEVGVPPKNCIKFKTKQKKKEKEKKTTKRQKTSFPKRYVRNRLILNCIEENNGHRQIKYKISDFLQNLMGSILHSKNS